MPWPSAAILRFTSISQRVPSLPTPGFLPGLSSYVWAAPSNLEHFGTQEVGFGSPHLFQGQKWAAFYRKWIQKWMWLSVTLKEIPTHISIHLFSTLFIKHCIYALPDPKNIKAPWKHSNFESPGTPANSVCKEGRGRKSNDMQASEGAGWQGTTRKWCAEAEGVTSASNVLQLYQLELMIALSLPPPPSVTFSCPHSHMHSPPVPSLTQTDALTLF